MTFGAKQLPCAPDMTELGSAMGSERLRSTGRLPPKERVNAAADALGKAGGDLCLLDAAGVIAFFSTMTIMVDSAGHSNKAFGRVGRLFTGLVWARRKSDTLHLPLGIAVLSAVAAAAVFVRRARPRLL
mmetsp:Transcript_56086/g.163876  ORF Transcript_56086/g.163876 Transcript_56086/m.163876 type:complete len:129 (-) Transcript_56086:181-567(-)